MINTAISHLVQAEMAIEAKSKSAFQQAAIDLLCLLHKAYTEDSPSFPDNLSMLNAKLTQPQHWLYLYLLTFCLQMREHPTDTASFHMPTSIKGQAVVIEFKPFIKLSTNALEAFFKLIYTIPFSANKFTLKDEPNPSQRTPHDFSFLLPKQVQTVVGKPKKPGKVYPPIFPNIGLLHQINYFHAIDAELNITYLTTEQKKIYKLKKSSDDLLYQGPYLMRSGEYEYVISPKGGVYVYQAVNNYAYVNYQNHPLRHSSIRAGQPVLCAGVMEVQDSQIVKIDVASGHYQPSVAHLLFAVCWMQQLHLLTNSFDVFVPAARTAINDGLYSFAVPSDYAHMLSSSTQLMSFHRYAHVPMKKVSKHASSQEAQTQGTGSQSQTKPLSISTRKLPAYIVGTI